MKEEKFTLNVEGKEIIVEKKNLAEQANGSVFVRCEDTLVMVTAVMGETKEDLGFFPLKVEYEEKYYAAGKIKGSRFIKREGRPSDEAVCNARLIDRAIRPQFPEGFKAETQVIATILSWDGENDPDLLGLIGASLALSISDIPWGGPLSCLRVGRKDGEYIINPTYKEKEESDLNMVFAATLKGGKLLINMMEGDFEETEEKDVMEAYSKAEKALKEIVEFQEEIKKKIGKEKASFKPLSFPELDKEIKGLLEGKLEKALFQEDKIKRSEEMEKLKEEISSFIEEKYPEEKEKANYSFDLLDKETDRLIHENVIQSNKRADGRKLDKVRELECQTGLIPRAHGSGLFCRGRTKALSILTLGSPGESQLLEGMEIVGKKRFMHHYNFPPYSAGEAKPLRGPGRREIGHGSLVERALLPVVPEIEHFPYTIRIVTEILSSNGSTSMASVSSCSLALMDAGIPVKKPVAGIAMGLILDDKGEYKLLTDIQGPEDHHGDMDFKAAGTKQGITAIQMDVKIDGITGEIMEKTLEGAKKARMTILETMEKTLAKPRENLSPYAPKILIIEIKPEKIGNVIGPGGKIINEIIDETGAEIDIEDSGKVFVTAEKKEDAEKALERIKNLTREVQEGEVFQGEVTKIVDFGAFVRLFPGQEGLIHISKLAPGRVNKVRDVVNVGDKVPVKVLSVNEQGKIDLILLKDKNK